MHGAGLALPTRVEHAMGTNRDSRLAAAVGAVVAAAVAVAMGLAGIWPVTFAAERAQAPDLIERVVAHATRGDLSIRATREMRAGARNGKHVGWMQVDTRITPASGFSWEVLDEGGSERTRSRVFRQLLQTEAQAWRAGAQDAGALTPANYVFQPLPVTPDGHIRIQLTPRRADSRLIDGTLTVSADGYPLRLEGRMAKSPSFWVRSVTIVTRYERIAGVALPMSVESLADVKMVGQSSFTMRYRYTEVNGRRVSHPAASVPSFGPSAELLALHARKSNE
jgi:hypothetical protein